MPALHRGLAGRVLALAGGENLAEDDFVDVGGGDLGALQGGLDGGGAEFMGRHSGESSVERADGGARGGNDHDIGRHGKSSELGPPPFWRGPHG